MEYLPEVLLFVAPLILSVLYLTTLHFFPWGRELTRPTSYALGTLATVGIPILAMLLAMALGMGQHEWFWIALLLVNTAVSGATVKLCYLIDTTKPVTLEDVHHGAATGR